MEFTSWLQRVHRTYAVFLLLVMGDVVLIAVSPTIRNALGRIDGWASLGIRVAPSLILVGFYSWFLTMGIRSKRTATTTVVLHSVLFSFLGVGTMVPWLGPFVAMLTPISVVYIGALLWLPAGYYAALLVALAFVGANLVLGKGALDQR